MKFILAFAFGVFITLFTLEFVWSRNPFTAPINDPFSRAMRNDTYVTELAKIPAASGVCATVKRELYTMTNGKKSAWYVLCAESPFIVSFWINEKGEVEHVLPEGTFQE